MFERFTDPARQIVVLSQEEARALDHDHIGTEHILLGLLRGGGMAGNVLTSLGIGLDDARREVLRVIGRGKEESRRPSGHIPFTPSAKKVLELSLREALQLGHQHIGTEHILLGIIREREGAGAQVLASLGADLDRARMEVHLATARPGGGSEAAAGPESQQMRGHSLMSEIADRLTSIEERLARIEAQIGMGDLPGAGEAQGAREVPGAEEAHGAEEVPGAGEAQGAREVPGVGEAQGAEDVRGAGEALDVREPPPGAGEAPSV